MLLNCGSLLSLSSLSLLRHFLQVKNCKQSQDSYLKFVLLNKERFFTIWKTNQSLNASKKYIIFLHVLKNCKFFLLFAVIFEKVLIYHLLFLLVWNNNLWLFCESWQSVAWDFYLKIWSWFQYNNEDLLCRLVWFILSEW